ncbi:MAG: Uma2 family endonuclease [Chloroflexia bacterium]
MASVARKTYTPDEYLALEREAKHRSEYINGEIYAMAGASEAHVTITGNLWTEIKQQLKGKPCRSYAIYMRVQVSATGMYTYPDLVATCGERAFSDAKQDSLTNPTFIAEVLSPSTEAYDRGEKFAHYRELPSLQEYVLVAQDKMQVERYMRHGEDWLLSVISDPATSLHATSIGCAIPLSEIYRDVEFPADLSPEPHTSMEF